MSAQKRKTKGTPDAVDVHVGKRLRVRRSLLGMSQEKLSDQVGITFQQIQKYEQGTNRISAGRLYKLSKVLNVPISYFFENIVGKSKASEPAYGMADSTSTQQALLGVSRGDTGQDLLHKKETLELVRAYYSIKDASVRKDFLNLIKSMASRD
jgi:transcriptional regulator with XRE-family HTH domain